MSAEERRASQGARRLQAVIASVAQQSRGRSLDETVHLLQVNLTMAGLRAPSGPWLDAVAREAVAGRSYVVATDALLLGLDDTAQAEALEHAPAELTTRIADRPSQPPTRPPGTPTAGGTAQPDPDNAAIPESQPTPGGVRRWDVWLVAGFAALALLFLLGTRRRSRAEPPSDQPTGTAC